MVSFVCMILDMCLHRRSLIRSLKTVILNRRMTIRSMSMRHVTLMMCRVIRRKRRIHRRRVH